MNLRPSLPRPYALAIVLVSSACEQTAGPRHESRVQAVLASSAGSPGSADNAGASPGTGKHSPPPGAQKVRVPFCSDAPAPARAFTPKLAARRVAASGEAVLPELKLDTKRWTWINFWAAWCVPCKQELPLLLEWKSSLASQLDFAFVSLDDDSRQLDQFLAEQPASGLKSSYWLPDGPLRQSWLAALDLTSEPELPMQLLVDPKGNVRCRIEGAVEAGDRATLERVLRETR